MSEPQYEIEIKFKDNELKEELVRGTKSNTSSSIIAELEEMITLIKEYTNNE